MSRPSNGRLMSRPNKTRLRTWMTGWSVTLLVLVASIPAAGQEALLEVLSQPFTDRSGLERYKQPPEPSERVFQTFCGT